ncbi:probable methyltransferase PMT13 [Tanacetum coccineum]|uniref:Methyltransferase n=1 Tax=Tanacetum coccineum TaxID=301880 RepID=A0ABQ5H3R3_9ASTR
MSSIESSGLGMVGGGLDLKGEGGGRDGDRMLTPKSAPPGVAHLADPKQRGGLISLIESGKYGKNVDVCVNGDVDYMPCEDPTRNSVLSREMNFYRERQCPGVDERAVCLVPAPSGYRVPIQWPESLHKIWHENMPYNKIADRKGHQGWMKRDGPILFFPGWVRTYVSDEIPHTHSIYRANQYNTFISMVGGALRTALDMGCGVASFGGHLLDENILTLSFAPRDSHKSQIQFFLFGERNTGLYATYFMEVDRLLRPGGYLAISGPPVQWAKQDKEWADLQAVARALCYELIVVDGNTVIWKKPVGDSCLQNQNELGLELCDDSDDPSSAWYVKLKKCVSQASAIKGDIAVGAIPKWPQRLKQAPSRATLIKNGNDVFEADTRRWERRISYYKNSLNLKLGTSAVRNVMDMNAFFGGFAASLTSDSLWVMNVVADRKPSTLGVIFDRGLIGVYHDCNLVDVMIEMDRLLRPEGTVVVRDSPEIIAKIDRITSSIRWKSTVHDKEPESQGRERILVATKTLWTLPSSSH